MGYCHFCEWPPILGPYRETSPLHEEVTMSNYCRSCGKPLPIDTDFDACWQHGGPPLKTDSQIRCPSCRETILADAKKCRFCGEFLDKGLPLPMALPAPKITPTLRELPATSGGSGIGWKIVGMIWRYPVRALILALIPFISAVVAWNSIVNTDLEKEQAGAITRQEQHSRELLEATRQKQQRDAELFARLTAPEHLTAARALLKPAASKNDVSEVLRHLDAIKATSNEFTQAQALLKTAQNRLAQLQQQENDQKLDQEMRSHPQDLVAGIVCKDHVKSILKAPATADFQSFLGRDVKDLGKWHYKVSSFVDSQNSFGANIRTTFTCDVQCVAQDRCVVIGFSSSP
jgi:hypothetical protein